MVQAQSLKTFHWDLIIYYLFFFSVN